MRPEILNPLFAPLSTIKGVGPKTEKWLSYLCGDHVLDLLFHLPIQIRHRKIFDREEVPESGNIIVFPFIPQKHLIPPRKRMPLRIIGHAPFGEVELVFFHYRGIKADVRFPLQKTLWISGTIQNNNGLLSVIHPDYIRLKKEEIPIYEPIYPLTQGAKNTLISKFIQDVLEKTPNLPEWLPSELLKKCEWKGWKESLKKIHFIESKTDISLTGKLRKRLAYDELLANQLALRIVRRNKNKGRGIACPIQNKFNLQLPFQLTLAQKRVINEIREDLANNNSMNRLLQGDVGSGKTIVAVLSALQVLENDFQVALMAPTDILARQHFSKIQKLLEPLGIKLALLTGKEKGKKRTEILEGLKSGEISFLVGTHALIEENVQFKNLAFAIIDEQHRFGVNQRLLLAKKQDGVNLLVLSATPIPRSLALTNYGDMDISILDQKPEGRKAVTTSIVSNKKLSEVIKKLKNWEGQVYWVCPLVEESEKSDLIAVKKRFAELQKVFQNQVALIHGKMKSEEKEAIMADFSSGKIKILVSTTVIEVGVDIPNASLMIIEHAERFGLATLHQLRGRVGRGTQESVCLLMYSRLSEAARERLTLLRSTDDGFKIAEADLRMRGAGEVLGWRQSGLENFRLAQLPEHQNLLELATEEAKMILASDPNLTSERGKAIRILLYLFQKNVSITTMKAG